MKPEPKKEKKNKEEEQEERDIYNYNEGRLACDRKWIKVINDRIRELESNVGIPELKRITKSKYKWDNQEENKKKSMEAGEK